MLLAQGRWKFFFHIQLELVIRVKNAGRGPRTQNVKAVET